MSEASERVDRAAKKGLGAVDSLEDELKVRGSHLQAAGAARRQIFLAYCLFLIHNMYIKPFASSRHPQNPPLYARAFARAVLTRHEVTLAPFFNRPPKRSSPSCERT